jgi:NADH-quinone oxidoreductase subunit C
MDASPLLDELQPLVPGVPLEPAPSGDGTPTVIVPKEHLVALCTALRDAPAQNYSCLSDLTCIDYWPQSPRYTMVYNLVSLGVKGFPVPGVVEAPKRLRVLVRLDDADPHAPTLSPVYPAANWAEREVFDLFGVIFDGHTDLRRILLPDDWEGHPLRKDYPVQVNVPVASSAALQLSEEEFVANMERLRAAQRARRS